MKLEIEAGICLIVPIGLEFSVVGGDETSKLTESEKICISFCEVEPVPSIRSMSYTFNLATLFAIVLFKCSSIC